jgi:hypothetical protein
MPVFNSREKVLFWQKERYVNGTAEWSISASRKITVSEVFAK